MGKQTTILKYIDHNFKTFEEMKFNEVDALIFAQMSYFDFRNLVQKSNENESWVDLKSLYKLELFETMFKRTLTPQMNVELIKNLCASPRFRDISLNFHDNIYDKESQEQFSAITIKLPTNEMVVAFRGTDLTITGWKEDLNMFFTSPVPSQISALKYLQEVSEVTKEQMFVVGHSKGGNLASYSSAFCGELLESRIKAIYNFDGPGFPTQILENSHFLKEQRKTMKFIPEGSIVGVIMEDFSNTNIVKSSKFGVNQHDPFSWICEDTKFVKSENLDISIRHADKSVNKWLVDLDISQKKILVETIFSIINSLEAENIDECKTRLYKKREEILRALKEIDKETADCIKVMISSYLKISFHSLWDIVPASATVIDNIKGRFPKCKKSNKS